jgi:hypothetical protein
MRHLDQPAVGDGFIVQDSYFSLLRERRIQFLDVARGFASIANTLRTLRGENDRLRRMREAIQDLSFDELDDFDEEHDIDGIDMDDHY